MGILHDWWHEVDPDQQNYVKIPQLRDFLKRKRIILRDSELKLILKRAISKDDPKTDAIRQSQFFKIFAPSMLRGAIINIFDYVQALTRHEMGRDTNDGQMIKVLKFQRDLVMGGLKSQHDVGGVDAQNTVLRLEELVRKYPEEFDGSQEREAISHDTILKYLRRRK